MAISGNAYIMVPPKNTTSNEGTRVTLHCQAEGYPNNITYRWFKNNEDVRLIRDFLMRASINADGSLEISTVFKEDTGWYRCRPSNGLGPSPEAQAYLNVTCEYNVSLEPLMIWLFYDDVIKWKHFLHNWPFVRGIHRSRWIPHTKASDVELWCFLWSASE